MSDLLTRSIAETVRGLRSGEFSATELVAAAIERHELFGERLMAYKVFDPERALDEARAADSMLSGEGDAPPLAGIPMSIKDLYGVDGMPTFAGTPRRLPDAWSRDSWLVARLREAGAVTVGKTHMVEMAFGGVGINPNWDTPWNPWDAEIHRIPGGSSSGAGVSLWEGSALLALGSDTGGSIRIPAAFTGTVGQRTTRGRWPTDGVVPLSSTFDTVGALTRTVEDSIYFFGCVDPKWGSPEALIDHVGSTDLRGLRIAVPVCEMAKACQTDIGEVLHQTLDRLRRAGVELVEIDGALLDDAFELSMGRRPIASTECRDFLERELPGWLEILHPVVGTRLVNALSIDDPEYRTAITDHRRMAAESESLFEQADILALPANIISAPPVADLEDVAAYGEANSAILRPTYPVSVLGLTGISLPVGLDAARMPVGFQLVARGGADERLLSVAWAVERLLGTAREQFGAPPLPPSA